MSRSDGSMYYENPRYLWAMFKLCALRRDDALARYYAQEAEMIEKLVKIRAQQSQAQSETQ